MMSPVFICHKGAPCTPPIVNDGIVFCPHPEAAELYVAEVTEEQASDLTRDPSYTRFGGDLTKLAPPTPGDPTDAPAYDLTVPASKWTNKALLVRVVETWATEAVQAKAVELGLAKPEDADRSSLMALVVAGKPLE